MTPPALDPALDYEPQPTRGRTKSSAAYTPREAADSALHSPAPAPPPVSRAGPRSSPERWSNPEEELEVYREMLEDRSVALVQLAPHIWVAEVYNVTQDRRMRDTRTWTHISATRDDMMELAFDCSNCKQFSQYKKCVHTLLLEKDAHDYLLFSESYDPQCVMFSHEEPEDDGKPSRSIFSVSRTQTGRRGQRCFVTRTGTSITGSMYACSACKHATKCLHIELSQNTLRTLKVLPESHGMSSMEDGEPEGREDFVPPPMYADLRARIDKADERSVSYMPVGLPTWARTGPEDDEVAGEYEFKRPLPTELRLSGDAVCRCGAVAGSSTKTEKMSCTVYDFSGAYPATIEVRRCASCPSKSRMMAGPDLGELGLFNFNNHTVISHALLNKYDAMLSANETTFHGFCQVMEREYEMYASKVPFMGEDRFRTCWFSFMNVQACGDAFSCDICGPSPRVVVVDGVTVGFQKRKQTSTLRPPTHTCSASAFHQDVKPPKTPLQLVPDLQLRKQAIALVRWALPGGRAVAEEQDMSIDHDSAPKPKRGKKKTTAAAASDPNGEPPFAVAAVASKLRKINSTLGEVFAKHVVPMSTVAEEDRMVHRQWLELLLQLTAHESVLQLAPFRAWPEMLVLEESEVSDSKLEACIHRICASVPALGVVLQSGWEARRQGDSNAFSSGLAILTFVREHCLTAWGEIGRYEPEAANAEQFMSDDWRESGCFYSMPQIRTRPTYPGLPQDGKVDRNMVSGTDGIGCSKFFAEYGKKGYTGGLLAIWCTHGICYGFHCIPVGEGRNDAFSAFYTRWEEAPKVVIYDFACALGPYCMLREAEFFKDTVFIIDRFHASGHKNCSPACFASNYVFDPDIKHANTSAAEFGNSGLKRIRLPVRYMSQGHAVVYIHRYLSVWNRLRRKKLARRVARR